MAQLTAEQLAQIEAACEQCSTGFGQQRADAERFVVGLRSAENALDMAHFIIANSQSDNARFHAAIMLKEATLRDWHKIPSAQRNGIKVNLLQHVVQSGALLKHFVRQPLLQVVAIMVKRGWFEEAPASFSEFLAYVQHLLENPATRTVGALMMRSLLEEFSSSNRSAVGLSWEFHNQCHHRFHAEGHLKMLFRLALTLLGGGVETLRAQSLQQEIDRLLSDAGECHWVGACVDIVNQTLSWDFSDTSSTGSVAGLKSMSRVAEELNLVLPH